MRRVPDVKDLTIATGSKLMNRMKANGELDHAKEEVEWAEMEKEPCLIQPWSPCEAIEEMEEEIRLGKAGQISREGSPPLDKGQQVSTGSSFERPAPGTLAQRLPRKVIVHDPWNLLVVQGRNRYGYPERNATDADWTTRPDRVYTYKLKLSDKPRPQSAAKKFQTYVAANLGKDLENKDAVHQEDPPANDYLIFPPPGAEGPIPPPIFVVHDPPPHNQMPASGVPSRKHTCISQLPTPVIPVTIPSAMKLNGSFPGPPSSVLLPPTPYFAAYVSDIDRTLKELDGEHGMAAQWKEKSAIATIKRVGRPQPHCLCYGFDEDDPRPERVDIEGYVRPIGTNMTWQDSMHPTCEHLNPRPEVPPTVRVRVVVKLSNPDNLHLERGATNYQLFPRHMFETWSGLNALPPMHDPFPIEALVPQLYGYYVRQPEEDDGEDFVADEGGDEEDDEKETLQGEGDTKWRKPPCATTREPIGYLSPILFLEECGTQVKPDE
ncbi:hypothetical protein DXG03_004383 [Asterophora parasitica]|uniref:Uncharacterized protein n=1 Tax=Asterophora parasitica TaxID=117018 RepID=A0A9P7G0N0_9AGAR|nr:hypothetical protein DXG03_004383 [Asterophora parasitica]